MISYKKVVRASALTFSKKNNLYMIQFDVYECLVEITDRGVSWTQSFEVSGRPHNELRRYFTKNRHAMDLSSKYSFSVLEKTQKGVSFSTEPYVNKLQTAEA